MFDNMQHQKYPRSQDLSCIRMLMLTTMATGMKKMGSCYSTRHSRKSYSFTVHWQRMRMVNRSRKVWRLRGKIYWKKRIMKTSRLTSYMFRTRRLLRSTLYRDEDSRCRVTTKVELCCGCKTYLTQFFF